MTSRVWLLWMFFLIGGTVADPIKVALLVPSTTRMTNVHSVDALPVIKLFAPSLCQTIDKDSTRFVYVIYLGYDVGDQYYDKPNSMNEVRAAINQHCEGYPVTVVDKKFDKPSGVCEVWNGLYIQAMEDGCEYAYQANDDLRLLTPGWTEKFVDALKNNPVKENFGMAGPTDKNNDRIMTQSFAGRVHYEIFGKYYPDVFKNWFSDDWGQKVYGPKNTFWLKDVHVRNSQPEGTRYVIDHSAGALLENELQKGRREILRYLMMNS